MFEADIKAKIEAKLVMTRLFGGQADEESRRSEVRSLKIKFREGWNTSPKGVSSGGSTTTQSERISRGSHYRYLRRKHRLSAWRSEPPKTKGVMTGEEARYSGFVNFQP